MSIGEFARSGGVSVRMLRHYDATGLLAPHAVDPVSGYRSYAADQLPRLHRITALASLGFTLAEVAAIVDDRVPPADLQGVLEARREQLQARIAADTTRLTSVEARLRAVEAGAVATHDSAGAPVLVTPLPPVRLAQLSTAVDTLVDDHSAVLARMFTELEERLRAAGVEPAGPRTSYLLPGVRRVHAGVVLAEGAAVPAGVEEARLPGAARAVRLRVVGGGEDSEADMRTAAWWLLDNGYRYDDDAPLRQLHLGPHPEDPAAEVLELQLPITAEPLPEEVPGATAPRG